MINERYVGTIDPGSIRKAVYATERIIRQHSRTFYFATRLLPAQERRAIRCLYAFCRATDDLVDREGASLQDVENWRKLVRKPAQDQENPVLLSWSLVRDQYRVDRRYEEELIAGVARDLWVRRYATWADLQQYCYGVASTVGLLSLPIIGMAAGVGFETASAYAIKLGIALQLTNILRDVGEDAANGRIYLPLEDLAAFGLREEDILDGVHDGRFIQLMRFEIARARVLYQEALPGIRMLSRQAQLSVGAAALLYRAILDEIEGIDFQVYRYRAHTSGLRKLGMLPNILYTVFHLGREAASL